MLRLIVLWNQTRELNISWSVQVPIPQPAIKKEGKTRTLENSQHSGQGDWKLCKIACKNENLC